MPMANGTDMTGASAGGKGGVGAGIAILAAVALVCTVARFIATGAAYPAAGAPRFIGEMIGGSLPSFVVGLIVFFIIRFVRRKSADRFAGVLSGLIVVLALAGLGYLGDLKHLAQ
ncbi:hypothetical protein [Rhizobium mesosinicum]|uniref:Uncharacterized protein n=1 Tax=Rhizobium mesosinicum TaxID=335017 RepID=A0ABS7GYH2_9HYPH|nr:hypothetical protein [Rhizobium mesosinicum]MBW9054872.1 hypothetical protein [Rhizobium mesosinicum]